MYSEDLTAERVCILCGDLDEVVCGPGMVCEWPADVCQPDSDGDGFSDREDTCSNDPNPMQGSGDCR